MRRITLPIIAILLALNLRSAGASGPVSQVLLNGGFETGDFAGWSLDGPAGTWSIVSSDKHSGTYSAHVLFQPMSAGRAPTLVSGLYTVAGSHSGTLTFWIRAPQLLNNGKLHILAEWYNAAYEPLNSRWETIQNTSIPNWVQHEVPMVFPADVAFAHVYLAAEAFSGDIVEAYVDDLAMSVEYKSAIFLPLLARP